MFINIDRPRDLIWELERLGSSFNEDELESVHRELDSSRRARIDAIYRILLEGEQFNQCLATEVNMLHRFKQKNTSYLGTINKDIPTRRIIIIKSDDWNTIKTSYNDDLEQYIKNHKDNNWELRVYKVEGRTEITVENLMPGISANERNEYYNEFVDFVVYKKNTRCMVFAQNQRHMVRITERCQVFQNFFNFLWNNPTEILAQ